MDMTAVVILFIVYSIGVLVGYLFGLRYKDMKLKQEATKSYIAGYKQGGVDAIEIIRKEFKK